jgi:hypothetical protein
MRNEECGEERGRGKGNRGGRRESTEGAEKIGQGMYSRERWRRMTRVAKVVSWGDQYK